MSGDEFLVLFVNTGLAAATWAGWFASLFTVRAPRSTAGALASIGAPLFSAFLMVFVLKTWAAHDVRDSILYFNFYMVFWAAWAGVAVRGFTFLGVSFRDDLLERGNTAAALTICGALIGVTIAFSGGNIGDGPGWWVVVFSSGLATGTLAVLWIAWNALTRIVDTITIERDTAAGWRAFGFFVGGGLIVGRAAAGNWISSYDTLRDFALKGWPLLVLWLVVVGMDYAWRPNFLIPKRNAIGCGVLPALLCIIAGAIVARAQGPW